METFVKGLNDHCFTITPRVKHLEIKKSAHSLVDRGLLWLIRSNFLATVEESVLHTTILNNYGVQMYLQSLVNLQSLKIYDERAEFHRTSLTPITLWECP